MEIVTPMKTPPVPPLADRARVLLDTYPWHWNGEGVVFWPSTPADSELSRIATALVLASDEYAVHRQADVATPVGAAYGAAV